MSTYAELKAQIADDLRRSDLTSQIARAVLSSVRDHGAERFWFNETRSYTRALSAGTSEYSLSEQAPVSRFVKIDWVKVPIGGIDSELTRVDPREMEILHASTVTGSPCDWTMYADRIRFYPTPDASYTATIAGHYRLVELEDETDENAWTTEAFDLIRYSALKRIFAFPVRNPDMAQMATAAEELELTYLRRETDRLKRSGQMMAYY